MRGSAFRHAPAEVRDRPSIRKLADDLMERHQRVAGVRPLAKAISRPHTGHVVI
jgi:hypothetical protein